MHKFKTKGSRKKVNFMLDEKIILKIKQYVPQGERSDFVNEVLEEALDLLARTLACESMDRLREENPVSITTEEFIELKNYGRE